MKKGNKSRNLAIYCTYHRVKENLYILNRHMFIPDISKYPSNAGVYLFKDRKGDILYIGKAKNLQKRIGQYFSPNSLRKQEMLEKASKVDFLMVKNESEALYLEDNLIKQHQPFYNNLLKADNSYVYIKITKESFPQIFLTRKKHNDTAQYIGPKKDSIQLKKFLQYLRQILKFRGCKPTQFKQGKLCSDYYFGLCRGRCTLTKEKKTSFCLPLQTKVAKPEGCKKKFSNSDNESEKEYKEIITSIISFFKGNTRPIEREILEQIEIAIIHENYERAAQLRNIYESIQGFVEKQNVVLPEKKDGYFGVIKNTGNRYIYTILIFTQGKLIDIITSKELINDIEQDSLELTIQRTFGEGSIKTNKEKTQIISQNIAKLGKKTKQELEKLAENFLESYTISQTLQEETLLINDMFKTLKNRYGLKNTPYKIECIDISHLSGGWTSGGLSCLKEGLPYKTGYRRYKIKAKKSDDYEALRELLQRRVQSGEELPSCLIIDGGKGQLNVVKKLCKDPEWKKIVNQIDIISLGKGEARNKTNIGTSGEKGLIGEKIYIFDEKLKIHETSMTYDQADKIFLKARDEAHRFANSYRKKQMSQERKN